MTFGEIQTEVFRRLEESGSSPDFWELDEVKQAIQEAWEDLALVTEWYRSRCIIPVQDDIVYYDLRDWYPEEVIKIRAIWDVSTDRWLHPSTWQEIQSGYQRWEAVEAHPDRFFLRGNFALGVWGKTTETLNSVLLDVYTVAIPPPLCPDDYEIPFQEKFHEALILYALYDLKSQEGEPDLALAFFGEYTEKAVEMAEWVRTSMSGAIERRLREDGC